MEKKLLKKDKLSGIVKKMAADKTALCAGPGRGQRPVQGPRAGHGAPRRLCQHEERAEEGFLSPLGALGQVHAEPQGDGICRHARGREGSGALRGAALRCPQFCPSGHALRPGEVEGPLLHREAQEKRGHLARLRAAALCVVLLHLRGREPHVDTGGRHPADRPGGELPRGVLDPQGRGPRGLFR